MDNPQLLYNNYIIVNKITSPDNIDNLINAIQWCKIFKLPNSTTYILLVYLMMLPIVIIPSPFKFALSDLRQKIVKLLVLHTKIILNTIFVSDAKKNHTTKLTKSYY